MTARIRESRQARGLFALLLVCVLAIRAAVPMGFMPVPSAQGIIVSLCTGEGATTVLLPIERKDGHSGDHKSAEPPCAFATGLGGGMVEPPSATFAVRDHAGHRPPALPAVADLILHRLAAPPPPALGPPAHA
ncbi:hypothetical protein [Sphingomonas colocasiae]|uniref:DUF2946 domain-containing protein n=1 Tax=Sphingomonas colocasiae TaxID=1848973 RepID=A0ABS7PVL5_9SPHN|nr:hypothetical protein [Sphingomonas colocasiae]MBY8824989.1 hypothetical protein [Sphingomonas colocasiae]